MTSRRLIVTAMTLVLSTSYAVIACSSSTATPSDGADASTLDASKGGTDASTSEDSSSPVDSGDAGTTTPSCSLPTDCTGTDVCCGTIPVTGGTIPNCTTGTISTVCTPASSCSTKLGSACSGTQTVRLCTTNKDCTESSDSSCCTFTDGDGGSLSFCANAFVGAFGGGKCQ